MPERNAGRDLLQGGAERRQARRRRRRRHFVFRPVPTATHRILIPGTKPTNRDREWGVGFDQLELSKVGDDVAVAFEDTVIVIVDVALGRSAPRTSIFFRRDRRLSLRAARCPDFVARVVDRHDRCQSPCRIAEKTRPGARRIRPARPPSKRIVSPALSGSRHVDRRGAAGLGAPRRTGRWSSLGPPHRERSSPSRGTW